MTPETKETYPDVTATRPNVTNKEILSPKETESRTRIYSVRGNRQPSCYIKTAEIPWTEYPCPAGDGESYIKSPLRFGLRSKDAVMMEGGQCCEWFFGSVLAGCCVEWERSNQQVYCRRNSSPWEAHPSDPTHAFSHPPVSSSCGDTDRQRKKKPRALL